MTDFSPDAQHSGERRAQFEEIVGQWHVPNRFRSREEGAFRASVKALRLGEVQISTLTHPRLAFSRTATLIRQEDPEVFHALLTRRGEGRISVGKHDANLGVGHLVLVDSSTPYSGSLDHPAGDLVSVVVQVPRTMLFVPPKALRRVQATPIPLSRGLAGVFSGWLTDITGRAHELTPADVPALSDVTTSILASVLGNATETETGLSPEVRRRTLREQIRQFIRRDLANPSLTPDYIAAVHQVSRRSLYTLFEEDGQTVSAWIRHERLERCRRDLADPRLAERSIHAIAARWGLPNKAHFSRVFRSVYGEPPRAYRRRAAQHGLLTTAAHAETTTGPRPGDEAGSPPG
ncbi:AraC-like ligand-binding domain-containing protein [Streptomyces sp. NPDC004726]